MIRLRAVAQIAAGAGVPAISLDIGSLVAQGFVARQQVPPTRVSSVWVGNPYAGVWTGPRRETFLADLTRRLGADAVVLDLGDGDGKVMKPGLLIKRLEQSRRLFGRDRRLIAAVRGHQLRGGRQHLADLTALRHLAEEWDFGIGLDLAGSFDPTWEAEAAVFRLGNYLRLLRVPTTATDRHAVGPSRVVSRAIAAAIDLGVPPEIALVPTVSIMKTASPGARSDSVASAATAIAGRVVSIKSQRAQFLNQGLWPNLRG